MRIAHISTQRGWNGGEQQACLLVRGLAERGHETLILARAGGLFGPRMALAGFPVVEFAGSGRSPRAMWQMRRQLAAWRADVVHFHDGHALSGGGLAAYRLPIGARIAARKVAFPLGHAWRYTRLADRVICVSRAAARCCMAGGIPADRLHVVHDGIDPGRIAAGDQERGRRSLGVQPTDVLLLSIGSLTQIKGHAILLSALPQVLARFPRVRLAVAGEGDSRAALERQVGELHLERSVNLLGYRSDVPDLLAAADLFVLPSLAEGLCSTLIDAMLARCPIVASEVGGVPELLASDAPESKPVGRLVPAGDSAQLAAALCEAVAQRSGLGEQIERAYARAMEQFTADRMVDGTLAVYREVLSDRAAA
jgi:glycosyltransferase involved in cell wall biosynthesis